jgi:cytochrome P450
VLQKLPEVLMPIKKRARELNKKEAQLYLGHWMTAKKAVLAGTANVSSHTRSTSPPSTNLLLSPQPCMCMDLVNSQNKENFSDAQVAYISGSMLEAGSDTSWNTLVGWVQAMVLFPDVARRAREEIEKVCGDRMPTLEDETQMQYIRGCVKESMRWMPTAPLGVPHAVVKDDFYMGYRIPKGASVFMNVWSVHPVYSLI